MTSAHSLSARHASAAHGSVRSYVLGFALSLLLTILSFGVVMSGVLPHSAIVPAIVVLAVAQLIVQLFFFLHIGTAPSQRDNTAIFACTALIIAIIVAGSLWVMHNANVNMMPSQMSTDQAMTRN